MIAVSAPPPVIPWVARRPAAAAAAPPLARACRAVDLRARLFLQGATGSLVGGVDLLNAGASPCALVGHPVVSFSGRGAASASWHVKQLAASPAPLDVVVDPPGSLRALAPGTSAEVAVFWSNWCGSGGPPGALVLRLPGSTTLSIPLTQAPRCDAPQSPSAVAVGPFAPTARRLPPSSRLPLSARIVGLRPVQVKPGLRGFRVRRGEAFRYEVALTNTGAAPFRFAGSGCPTYVEQIATARPQPYVLNCRAAGSIAPHATVRFAMRIVIPPHARLGNNSLTWELAPTTYAAPFAPAALQVAP